MLLHRALEFAAWVAYTLVYQPGSGYALKERERERTNSSHCCQTCQLFLNCLRQLIRDARLKDYKVFIVARPCATKLEGVSGHGGCSSAHCPLLSDIDNTHRNSSKSADFCFTMLYVQLLDVVSDKSASLALWSLKCESFLEINEPLDFNGLNSCSLDFLSKKFISFCRTGVRKTLKPIPIARQESIIRKKGNRWTICCYTVVFGAPPYPSSLGKGIVWYIISLLNNMPSQIISCAAALFLHLCIRN